MVGNESLSYFTASPMIRGDRPRRRCAPKLRLTGMRNINAPGRSLQVRTESTQATGDVKLDRRNGSAVDDVFATGDG